VKKEELKSFNAVVRDISSLVELSDEALEGVVGGLAVPIHNCPSDIRACEPDCGSNCPNLA
jgi:hypothetical protein